MNRFSAKHPALATAAVALALCGAIAGCGDSGDESASATAAKPAAASTDAGVANAKARVAKLEKGLATQPPTSGPKAQVGKSVWAISCGDFAESCSVVTDATMAAGKAIGWKMTRFDAKVDPARAADGIRQAIAAKADAVIVSAFDCTLIKAALKDAKDAGVVTYGSGTSNCDDPISGDGSAPLYTLTDVVPPDAGRGWSGFSLAWGADKANYVIDRTNGKAKVINLEQSDLPSVGLISQGFAKGLKACQDCEIVETLKYTGAQTANNGLTQAMTNALSSHPEANAIHLPVDSLLPNVAPAIQESGRSKDLLVVGGEGNFKANTEEIRKGGVQDASIALDLGWESWAQVDDLNRAFAGQKPVYGGWAWTVLDKDHNLPAAGEVYNSTIDYAAKYRELWGR